jgi:hypothetical protein
MRSSKSRCSSRRGTRRVPKHKSRIDDHLGATRTGAVFDLVHEVLIHSYKGWADPQVLGDKFFTQQHGLYNDGHGWTMR